MVHCWANPAPKQQWSAPQVAFLCSGVCLHVILYDNSSWTVLPWRAVGDKQIRRLVRWNALVVAVSQKYTFIFCPCCNRVHHTLWAASLVACEALAEDRHCLDRERNNYQKGDTSQKKRKTKKKGEWLIFYGWYLSYVISVSTICWWYYEWFSNHGHPTTKRNLRGEVSALYLGPVGGRQNINGGRSHLRTGPSQRWIWSGQLRSDYEWKTKKRTNWQATMIREQEGS